MTANAEICLASCFQVSVVCDGGGGGGGGGDYDDDDYDYDYDQAGCLPVEFFSAGGCLLFRVVGSESIVRAGGDKINLHK